MILLISYLNQIALTLPGGRVVYKDQTRGFKVKLPVQLGRRLFEEENKNLSRESERI